MSRSERFINRRAKILAAQASDILHNYDHTYDLVGRRLALRGIELTPHLQTLPFRLGVVGNPNLGKTTLAYSYFKLLEVYGVPTQYVDLDLYSQSGPAIAGEIAWDQRTKRNAVPEEEVLSSIAAYNNIPAGLVVADFPGRISNPHNPERIRGTDLILILTEKDEDRYAWMKLVSDNRRPFLWLQSVPSLQRTVPIHPSVRELMRKPKPFSIDVMISLTRILEMIAEMNTIPLHDIWTHLTQAERVVLEEVLDFEFAPLSPSSFSFE